MTRRSIFNGVLRLLDSAVSQCQYYTQKWKVKLTFCQNLFFQPGSTEPLLSEVVINVMVCAPPKSPYIVQMIEWFDQTHQFVIVMEYPHPCQTLLEFTMCHGCCLDESVARGLMRQAVLAAKHCIERGILHNDIKTDNMLVNTETLQLKLIDFSCSKRINMSCSEGELM